MRFGKLISDLGASTVSSVGSQVLNAGYFVAVAAWLPKAELGIYAASVATASVIANLLTFGNTPVIVRRIAAVTSRPFDTVSAALFQRVAFPVIGVAALGWLLRLFPHVVGAATYVVWATMICCLGQVSTVLKRALAAKTHFWSATIAEHAGLLVRILLGIWSVKAGLGALALLNALLAGYVAEILIATVLVRRLLGFWPLPRLVQREFPLLIREGLPLAGALLFDGSISRADWYLMGVFRNRSETGEYSFAYRLFEICWLPHSILGSILLPRLSAAIADQTRRWEIRRRLTAVFRVVAAASVFPPLWLALCWTPAIDFLTLGKYGASCERILLALVISVPFVAGSGTLWIVALAERRGKAVLAVTAVVSLCNLGLDVILIPRFGGLGAAASASLPMVGQCIAYIVVCRSSISPSVSFRAVFSAVGSGLIAYCASRRLGGPGLVQVLVASGICVGVIALVRSMTLADITCALNGIRTESIVCQPEPSV